MNTAKRGDSDLIRILLNAKANHNIFDSKGYSALMHAVTRNYSTAVKLLLENGADPNLANKDGLSPIMIAHRNGNNELELLMNKKIK